MQALDALRQQETQHEIHHGHQGVHLDHAAVALRDFHGGADEVGDVEQRHQRHVLEQHDGLGEQHRQHIAQRLRQDDQPHRLRVGQAQRIGRAELPFGNALDARAHDLREIRRLEQNEGEIGRALRPDLGRIVRSGDRLQHHRHQEVEPENHQQQRNRAHQIDVARRQQGQPLQVRQPRQGQQNTQQRTADGRHHGELDGVGQPLEQKGQDRDDGAKVKIAHHLLPPI